MLSMIEDRKNIQTLPVSPGSTRGPHTLLLVFFPKISKRREEGEKSVRGERGAAAECGVERASLARRSNPLRVVDQMGIFS